MDPKRTAAMGKIGHDPSFAIRGKPTTERPDSSRNLIFAVKRCAEYAGFLE